jgi:ketosteroid isomerase-like protein
MSHHFDTPTAREDPRIYLCDFYLFSSGPASTVMAMTVNPDAGLSAPDTFREEGLYAFRFDLDGDAREELAFKVTFGPPSHADGDDHKHEQSFEVRRSTGAAALKGANGDLIATGTTGAVVKSKSGVTVFAGLAPDLFAVDATGFNAFRAALFNDNKFAPAALRNGKNFFGAAFFAHVADDVDWTVMGTHPLAGRYRSRDAYAGTFVKLAKVLPHGAQLQVEHVLVKDNEAVVELRSLATARNEMRFDNRYCMVLTFDGETIVRGRSCVDSALVARLFAENPIA